MRNEKDLKLNKEYYEFRILEKVKSGRYECLEYYRNKLLASEKDNIVKDKLDLLFSKSIELNEMVNELKDELEDDTNIVDELLNVQEKIFELQMILNKIN